MALTWPAVYQSLLSTKTAGNFPLGGPSYDSIVRAVAIAVTQWAVGNTSNLALAGQVFGLTGPGTIVTAATHLTVLPNPGAIQVFMIGAGFTGPLAASVATAIATGIASAFTTYGQYSGVSSAVASGTDVSVLTISNGLTLSGFLVPALISNGVAGPITTQLATGLGRGIAGMLLGSSGTGVVVGTPIIPPTPTVGPTFSSVV